MRYQPFIFNPTTGGWASLNAPVSSVDVAIDWILHYLKWVELVIRGEGVRHEAVARVVNAEAMFAVVAGIPDDEPRLPAWVEDFSGHQVARRMRLTKDTTHHDWRWAIEDTEAA